LSSAATSIRDLGFVEDLLACPQSGESLHRAGDKLVSDSGRYRYDIDASGIPLFAKEFLSAEAAIQQKHYDEIAEAYTNNLGYPHTVAYMDYLDDELKRVVGTGGLGTCAELCCGNGEAFALLGDRMSAGVGIDVSTSMLHKGQEITADPRLVFVQGDATRLPLADGSFDSVVILGGIHHVPDRQALFAEAFRVLRPGGVFIWREPVSDFWLWKFLRAIVYRLSPMLDHETERPLTWDETVPVLQRAGFRLDEWRTCGFFGFCIFMNSDVLFFNRLFRFVPGISAITRAFARFDRWCTNLPGLRRAGLQVVGKATKPDLAGDS
jgi:ubiquinone/menaquinone biosynthesis C-methylase UbiE